MTQLQQSAGWLGDIAADAQPDSRADFIRKTYAHLAGAIGAFVIIEFLIFQLVPEETLRSLIGTVTSGYMWLVVLGAFLGVSWLAHRWADSATSLGVQYAGLGLYVVAEGVIFVPLLYVAQADYYNGAITTAAVSTLAMFATITAVAFLTGKNFSFLGGALAVAGMAAMVVIVLSIVMGFELGLLFTVLMIAFACGFILYDTSNVIHNYRIGQHVAASLALFASVALLFWYVLRLVMILNRE